MFRIFSIVDNESRSARITFNFLRLTICWCFKTDPSVYKNEFRSLAKYIITIMVFAIRCRNEHDDLHPFLRLVPRFRQPISSSWVRWVTPPANTSFYPRYLKCVSFFVNLIFAFFIGIGGCQINIKVISFVCPTVQPARCLPAITLVKWCCAYLLLWCHFIPFKKN